MKITKEWLALLKTARSIVIRFNNYPTIDLFHGDSLSQERVTTTKFECAYNLNGAWVLSLYPNQQTEEGTIIDLLRADDEMIFSTRVNGTDQTKEDGYTVTELMLSVKRYKKSGSLSRIMTFVFGGEITKHNPSVS